MMKTSNLNLPRWPSIKFRRSHNPAYNDEWAHSLFPEGGFFVEVGAHSLASSSCYELEKMGWDGIWVEPLVKQYNKMKKTRTTVGDNCCLLDADGEITFLECGQISTTIDKFMKTPDGWYRQMQMRNGIISIKKTITLEKFLAKHNAPKTIEFLAMDIEQNEYQVLKNFPFNKYNILAMALEGATCTNLLKRNGYTEVINPWCNQRWERYYVKGVPNQ